MSDLSDFSDTDFEQAPAPRSSTLRTQISRGVQKLKSQSSGVRRTDGVETRKSEKKTESTGARGSGESSKVQIDRETSSKEEDNAKSSAVSRREPTKKKSELKSSRSSGVKDTATGVLSPPEFFFSCIVHDGHVFRPRTEHMVVELGNTIYIWGGKDGDNVLNEMIQFFPASTTFRLVDVLGESPAPVLGAALVVRRISDKSRPVLSLFGGMENNQTLHNEIWNFDPETLKWEKIKTIEAPTPRRGHSMCVGGKADVLYLWGGVNAEGVQNDGYVLKGDVWTKLEDSSTVPPGRCFHSAVMATDEEKSEAIYVFGGDISGRSRPTNELWMYLIQRKTWEFVKNVTGQPPGPRFKHAAAFYDNRIWISGGETAGWFSTYAVSDFFVYDVPAKCWFQCDVAAKQLGYHANFGAMALVPRNKALYVFGGSDSYGNPTSGVYRLAPVCTSVSIRDLRHDLEGTIAEVGKIRSALQKSNSDTERVTKLMDTLESSITNSVERVSETLNKVAKFDVELDEIKKAAVNNLESVQRHGEKLRTLETKLTAILQLEKKFESMERNVHDVLAKVEGKADQSALKDIAKRLELLTEDKSLA